MKIRSSRSAGCRATLPIHSVSLLTNISVDTIRAWEKRYGAIKPARAASGQRLFSPNEVARLVLLRTAVEAGESISRIAPLADIDLQRVVHDQQMNGDSDDAAIARLFKRICAMDAKALAHDLCAISLSQSAIEFADDIITPLLAEISLRTADADKASAQRLLLCETLRFVAATLFAKYEQPAAAAVMLFLTLPGEKHAVPPLLAALVASELGYHGIFGGTEIAPRQIVQLATSLHAVGLGIFAGVESPDITRLAREVAKALPSIPLFAGGTGLRMVSAFQATQTLRDFAAILLRGPRTLDAKRAAANA
jgi:MerR family transcriptional regulator, light-induced transcriptional regulator